MHWQIDHLQAKYIPQLQQLYLASRVKTFTWLDTAKFKRSDFQTATQNEEVRVAVLNRKPIGFISWWTPDNFIHNLYVDQRFMRQGVGKALLDAGLAELERPASLKCLQQNTSAVAFYHAHGWRIKAEGQSDEGPYFLMVLER